MALKTSEAVEYHATIREMPVDDRPRERLQYYGPEALQTAELLAIILRTGTTKDNVIELSSKLLQKYGGLAGLMRADFGDLCNEHGLGAAKASQIKAALELGRRLAATQPEERVQVRSPADAAKLVMLATERLLPVPLAVEHPRPVVCHLRASSAQTPHP